MSKIPKLVYVQTHGLEAPERSATPFYLAAAAAAMDIEASIVFTINGTTLLRKGVAEQVKVKRGDEGESLRYFIDQARELGVKLFACQPSMDLHDIPAEELIEGVEIIGGAAFNDMALEADQVITF